MKKKKILIDTDIGNDIDDAIAVCTALQSEELEVLAITTVYCATDKRAKMVKALLNSCNRGHIPVYAGSKYPLYVRKRYGKEVDFNAISPQYSSEFDDVKYDGDDAVEKIIEILENAQEPINILTIGALTNIAKVLMKKPNLENKIECIYIMGGGYKWNIEEFNFACDPHAASFILSSNLKMKLIGVDLTFQCQLTDEHEKLLANSENETLKILWKMKAGWTQKIHIHDVLALMCIVDENKYVEFENTNVDVDYESEKSSGRIVNYTDFNWYRPAKNNQLVGIKVNSKVAVEDCMERLMKFK